MLESSRQEKNFESLFAPFEKILLQNKTFAVAVSGGSDSMAMCLIANEWAKKNSRMMVALTVNHQLRKSAGDEARIIGGWLEPYKINHYCLNWNAPKPKFGLQASARQARYDLMIKWCKENNIFVLMTGHHLQDQVETFLLRTEQSSGTDGLASMNALSKRKECSLLRPLLKVPKERLQNFLRERQQEWFEDPSNNDPKFRRTHVRHIVNQLVQNGLPLEVVSNVIDQFGVLRQNFDDITNLFLRKAVKFSALGYGTISYKLFTALPEVIIQRILVHIALEFGGKIYPPRGKSLRRLIKLIKKQEKFFFSLGGCQFIGTDNCIIFFRDRRSLQSQDVASGDEVLWGNSIKISICGPVGQIAKLAPLGKRGWLKIGRASDYDKPTNMPHTVHYSMPSLFDENGVLHVPSINYYRPVDKINNLRIASVKFVFN